MFFSRFNKFEKRNNFSSALKNKVDNLMVNWTLQEINNVLIDDFKINDIYLCQFKDNEIEFAINPKINKFFLI